MRSTFSGMEIARRSLMAHRQALDVTGHNIANANTPGYSRQVARLTATPPVGVPSLTQPTLAGQMGTGVEVKEVVRMADAFIQYQINEESQALGYWQRRGQILKEIELTFLEPTDAGIHGALEQFWNAFHELSKNPESHAVRSVVRERAAVLTDTIRSVYDQLEPLKKQLDTEIRAMVSEINTIAGQIAVVNREIGAVIANGNVPNDLLDQRDALVQRLSELIDVQVVELGHGMIGVANGGVSLVDGVQHREILIEEVGVERQAELYWSGIHQKVNARSGELKALLEGRDEEVPYYIDRLNELAATLIETVNEVHRQGYGLIDTFDPNQHPPHNPSGAPAPPPPGRDFFKTLSGDEALNAAKHIALSRDILTNLNYIAASKSGAAGDGGIALELAQLRHGRLYDGGTATPAEFLSSIVTGLGVHGQRAEGMIGHQQVLVDHLDRLRASVSSVSLDEEMSNLIMYQHAYAAASRLVTTIDESIDTIINRMGLVGR